MSRHDDLRRLLQRYARAVDARDLDELAPLFHPDATVTGTGGVQSLDAWLATMRAPRAFPTSMHMIGEPLITGEEIGDTAALDTYAVVFQLGDQQAGQGDLTLGVRYLDEVVRHEEHWVFRHRTSRTLWMR